MTYEERVKLRDLIDDWVFDELSRRAHNTDIFEFVDALVREARSPLVALLRELAEEPNLGADYGWTGDCDYKGCAFCAASADVPNDYEIHHTPECPVTRARALLAGAGEDPR